LSKYLIFLGRAIRDVRELHDLSANDLAAAAGVAPARVAALEDGQRDPDFELLAKLARSMGAGPSVFTLRAEELAARDAEGKADHA
jgi:transcriptional regulator with XRE-family HTH domain